MIEIVKIEGKFSIIGTVDRMKNPPIMTITGIIETPVRLPDRFEILSGGRLIVEEGLIDSESLGSEDDNIMYGFTAKRYKIKKIQK